MAALALAGCGEASRASTAVTSEDAGAMLPGEQDGGTQTLGSDDAGEAGPGPGSSGCGATTWPEGDQRAYPLLVGGTQRKYVVTIPESYDPNHPYRLVFTWHDRGETAESIASGFGGSGYYGLLRLLGESTILVSGQGLGSDDAPDEYGWSNDGGRDIAFVRELLDEIKESYCIDQSRIYSTGMGEGGTLSIAIGCELSDAFRGIAAIAGELPAELAASCTPGPLAALLAYGTSDDVVTSEGAERARDAFLTANGCQASARAIDLDPCVAYDGCRSGYPLLWCAHDGGHVVPSFASAYIALLFEQL